MEKKKRIPMAIKIGLMLICIVIGIYGFIFYREYTRPTKEGKKIEVEIKEGTSTKKLVTLLRKKKVIHVQLPFYVKLLRMKSRGKLRYGFYELNDGMSLDDLIRTLEKGGKETSSDTIVVTIPDGFSVEMIAERLEAQGIFSKEEFFKAVKDKAKTCAFAQELPEEDAVYYSLQGYLYPDTYHLEKEDTVDVLVDMMLKEFEEKYDDNHRKEAEEAGLSTKEVLTMASLVQKETDLKKEYPTIAGVIYNRLEQKMRLQFDSTVAYAMTEGQYGVDRIMYEDLKYDSPYNTYKIDGLPVGPICNPGLEAIDAVIHPEEHDYLFFQIDCVKNDGSNLFFENYEDHLAASSTMHNKQETTASDEKAEEKSSEATTEEKSSEATTEEKAEKKTESKTK